MNAVPSQGVKKFFAGIQRNVNHRPVSRVQGYVLNLNWVKRIGRIVDRKGISERLRRIKPRSGRIRSQPADIHAFIRNSADKRDYSGGVKGIDTQFVDRHKSGIKYTLTRMENLTEEVTACGTDRADLRQ